VASSSYMDNTEKREAGISYNDTPREANIPYNETHNTQPLAVARYDYQNSSSVRSHPGTVQSPPHRITTPQAGLSHNISHAAYQHTQHTYTQNAHRNSNATPGHNRIPRQVPTSSTLQKSRAGAPPADL
jgi:hypothetical protein